MFLYIEKIMEIYKINITQMQIPPLNKVRIGPWGLPPVRTACGTYSKHFPRLKFVLLPNRSHAHPSATKPDRWAADLGFRVMLLGHESDR